jgi:hypothetical protein
MHKDRSKGFNQANKAIKFAIRLAIIPPNELKNALRKQKGLIDQK